MRASHDGDGSPDLRDAAVRDAARRLAEAVRSGDPDAVDRAVEQVRRSHEARGTQIPREEAPRDRRHP